MKGLFPQDGYWAEACLSGVPPGGWIALNCPHVGWVANSPPGGWVAPCLSCRPQGGLVGLSCPQGGWVSCCHQGGWVADCPLSGWVAANMRVGRGQAGGGPSRSASNPKKRCGLESNREKLRQNHRKRQYFKRKPQF